MQTPAHASTRSWRLIAVALGLFSLVTILSAYHIADGDLWGKLSIGAHFWHYGNVPVSDYLAFTPVLPRYIEHEWGAGAIFFAVLKWCGPEGLMLLKIGLACGAMIAAMATGRRIGCSWNVLLVLAVMVVPCLLIGYIPVIRSHAFTYCFFAITLLGLEAIKTGSRWPAFVLPAVMLVWSNVHGGFVAGLGGIFIYTAFAVITRQHLRLMIFTAVACALVTLVNIYGLKFWAYLIPAILNKRPRIEEWQPLPLLGNDLFLGFRLLFAFVVLLLAVTWRRTQTKSWAGLAMLCVTAMLAWRSRRHAPFFAVTTLAFVGPFLKSGFDMLAAPIRSKLRPAFAVAILYGGIALFAALHFLPRASWIVLAPVGHDPVREMDILSRANISGNLATPFGWGCYCAWRLHPAIKISMDGRYETTYPESTFQLNNDFYEKRGTNWDRLIREYPVDFVLLGLNEDRLRPEDLYDHGYVLIWMDEGQSALLALQKHAPYLKQVVAELPPTTINPLDASITDKWWTR